VVVFSTSRGDQLTSTMLPSLRRRGFDMLRAAGTPVVRRVQAVRCLSSEFRSAARSSHPPPCSRKQLRCRRIPTGDDPVLSPAPRMPSRTHRRSRQPPPVASALLRSVISMDEPIDDECTVTSEHQRVGERRPTSSPSRRSHLVASPTTGHPRCLHITSLWFRNLVADGGSVDWRPPLRRPTSGAYHGGSVPVNHRAVEVDGDDRLAAAKEARSGTASSSVRFCAVFVDNDQANAGLAHRR